MTRLLISARITPYAENSVAAVRNGAELVESDGVWSEAFGPDAFLAGGRNATIQDGHDATVIGEVVVLASRGAWWEMDGVIESDDAELIARVKPGAPVSVGCRILTRSTVENVDTRVRLHKLAQLEHVAIVTPDERALYRGARITSVVESKVKARQATTSGDWLAGLPDEWRQSLTRLGYKPGDIVELGEGDRVAYRWDGARFVAAHARAA